MNRTIALLASTAVVCAAVAAPATLAWDASTNAVDGYRLYAATNSFYPSSVVVLQGSPDLTLTALVPSITATAPGIPLSNALRQIDCGLALTGAFADLWPARWYFVATAYLNTGEESLPSNEVTYVVPVPRVITVWAEQSPSLSGPWRKVASWPTLTLTNPVGDAFYRINLGP